MDFEGVSEAFQECSREVSWMADGILGSFIGFRRFSELQVRSMGTSGDPKCFKGFQRLAECFKGGPRSMGLRTFQVVLIALKRFFRDCYEVSEGFRYAPMAYQWCFWSNSGFFQRRSRISGAF